MKQPRAPFSFHPLLLAVFPALSLLAANIDQVSLSQGLRITLASLLLGILTYGAARWVLRGWPRAAPVASLILVALLTYGRLYDGLKEAGLSGETIVRHRLILPVCVVLVAAGVVWCARRREVAGLNRVLNVISVVAIALPIVTIASHQVDALTSARSIEQECTLQPPRGQPLPDIYLIVMDGYERDDVLRDLHGYDNSPFLRSLEEMGFYVARGSLSNYRPTEMSLSSMLNMAYVEDFPALFGARPNNRSDLFELLNHSRVRQELECLGYVTVAFETGFFTEWDDADYYFERQARMYGGMELIGKVSRLEYLYLEMTAGRALIDGWMTSHPVSRPEALDLRGQHRELVLFTFARLQEVPALPSPKLVFAHIVSPHPPFVFGANGETINRSDFETTFSPDSDWQWQAYADQVAYLNRLLLEVIRAILDQSQDPPIIVLMGDHGMAFDDLEDRLSNLNALLIPSPVELYPTITPVNTFRLIFDGVFGTSLGKLPDISYYSSGKDRFNVVTVPNTWRPGSR